MPSALTAGLYGISSAITGPYLTLWFDSTPAHTPASVQGMFNPPGGIWNFTKQNGKWSIKDMNSGLYFGYNTSKPKVSTPIMAVKKEILWDIVQSDMSGNYQLSVPGPSMKLTATLADLNSEEKVSLHLSHATNSTVANGIDSHFWQDWTFELNKPIVKIEELISTATVTSTVTLVTVTSTAAITTTSTATEITVTVTATSTEMNCGDGNGGPGPCYY